MIGLVLEFVNQIVHRRYEQAQSDLEVDIGISPEEAAFQLLMLEEVEEEKEQQDLYDDWEAAWEAQFFDYGP